LDAYDRIHRETEDILEIKSSRVSQLEALLKENNIPIPKETNETEVLTSFRRGNESERGYIQNNPDMVNYDGQETYNITRNNLSNAEGKIIELTQVAENQKNEINRLRAELENSQNNTFDTSEFMKNEIHILSDKVKKSEEGQQNLKEVIKKKDDEIWHLQKGSTQKGFSNYQNHIKVSLDNIIECLSSENEPYKLQNVARELLTLQKLVNDSTLGDEKPTSTSQLISEKSSPTNSLQSKSISSIHRHTNSEIPSASDTYPQQRNSPTRPLITNHINSSLHAENINLKKTQSQSNSGRNVLEQSKTYNSLNNRKEGELDHGNKLESKTSGVHNNHIDQVPSINPTRQAMSVEEMLQIKRNESAKKK